MDTGDAVSHTAQQPQTFLYAEVGGCDERGVCLFCSLLSDDWEDRLSVKCFGVEVGPTYARCCSCHVAHFSNLFILKQKRNSIKLYVRRDFIEDNGELIPEG